MIEDCAQSIGAKYKGQQTGSLGTVNATSFYPGKNLGAYGEGGASMTNDSKLADRMRRSATTRSRAGTTTWELGFNWRMDGFQGAVLSIKLAHLDAWNARRREIAAKYLQAFEGLKGVRTLPKHSWSEAIWHLFPIFHDRRDDFRAALEKRGVQSGVHYPTPIHLQPAYAHLGVVKGSLPQSERAAATEISLPMFPELTDAQADEVIAAVKAVAAELG